MGNHRSSCIVGRLVLKNGWWIYDICRDMASSRVQAPVTVTVFIDTPLSHKYSPSSSHSHSFFSYRQESYLGKSPQLLHTSLGIQSVTSKPAAVKARLYEEKIPEAVPFGKA